MISETFIFLAVFIFTLSYFLSSNSKKAKKLGRVLNGPKGYPLVGNLFDMEKLQYITFCKWAKQYGPIYRVNLASTNIVVISDYKLVKEMFSETVFSGRLDFSLFDLISDGNVHGVIFSEGNHWEELRRFTMRKLKEFGFGRKSLEESILTEVDEFIEGIKEFEGKSISNMKDRFLLAVVNSLWSIVTGKRHKQNDPQLLALSHKTADTFNETIESGGFLLFAPWVAKWFPKWSGYEKVKNNIIKMAAFYRDSVEEHKKTYSDDYQRDFVDVFLNKIKNTVDTNSAFNGKLGEENLLSTMSDLYFAGTDTTAVTLSWLILYMAKFPDKQIKFQKEIASITGNTRSCRISDKSSMPYTGALLSETLRMSSIISLGVQHKAIADAEFKGYRIPKGTVLASNLYYIHHDPEVWGDPENFRPERFLSADGKIFNKHDALLAFSTGRRECLGQNLARDTLFLFATNIFQKFSVQFDDYKSDPGMQSAETVIRTPKPYNVVFREVGK